MAKLLDKVLLHAARDVNLSLSWNSDHCIDFFSFFGVFFVFNGTREVLWNGGRGSDAVGNTDLKK